MRTKQRHDVIIVFGAAVWKGGRPSHALMRRTTRAAELMNRGVADRLIVTGGLGKHPPAEADLMHDLAVRRGVDPALIIREDQSKTTLESVLRCTRILEEHGWTRALAVSDIYHLPRIYLAFRIFGRRLGLSAPRNGAQRLPVSNLLFHMLRESVAIPGYLFLAVWKKRRMSEKTRG